MNALKRINVGMVGVGRPLCLWTGLKEHDCFHLQAACDTNTHCDQRTAMQEKYGLEEVYSEYDEMLEKANLDLVMIGVPMTFHVEMAVKALEKGIHVISEVTAAMSIEESRCLVKACQKSSGTYIMAENAIFLTENYLIGELVKAGLFGDLYYGEGEYIHELKAGAETKPIWQKIHFNTNGITYGTHQLGPLLYWMKGDRVKSVCCIGSGGRHQDQSGNFFQGDSSRVMLCKMASGSLLEIRQDVQSDRPHITVAYALQGMDGCYESARWPDGTYRVWLKSRSKNEKDWLDLMKLKKEFLPDYYTNEKANHMVKTGTHRGGDYFTGYAIGEMLLEKRKNILGIHEAMDMTLPGLVSQQSILVGGKWLEVPDSRNW